MPNPLVGTSDAQKKLIEAAAKLMIEARLSDVAEALVISANRLGQEISIKALRDAVLETCAQRLQLFDPKSAERLQGQKAAALDAMQALQSFQPKLTGALSAGVAIEAAVIELALLCEHPDDVCMELMAKKIPFEQRLKSPRPEFRKESREESREVNKYSEFEFRAGAHQFKLIALCKAHYQRVSGLSIAQLKPQV